MHHPISIAHPMIPRHPCAITSPANGHFLAIPIPNTSHAQIKPPQSRIRYHS
jgi:hypothetical protein